MLIKTFMISVSREYINEDFWLSTIVIETGDISPIKLDLDAEEKHRLFEIGRATTLGVLRTRSANASIALCPCTRRRHTRARRTLWARLVLRKQW